MTTVPPYAVKSAAQLGVRSEPSAGAGRSADRWERQDLDGRQRLLRRRPVRPTHRIIDLTGRGKISEVRELVTASAGARRAYPASAPNRPDKVTTIPPNIWNESGCAFACADLVDLPCRGAGWVSEPACTGPAGHLRAAAHRQRRAAFQRRASGERRRRPSGRRQGPDPAVGA